MSSSIWYYEPSYDLDRLQLDKAPQHPSHPRSGLSASSTIKTIKPLMDIHENHDNNIVTATFELPGLKKEDVNIDINNNRMTVSGESGTSSDREEGHYAVRERSYGMFSRTLQLPLGVKENQIKAHLENGVLTVQFPKTSAEIAHKRIAIN